MFGSKKKSKKEESKDAKKKLEKKDSKEGKVKESKDKSAKEKCNKESKSKSGKENKNGSDKKRNSGENQEPGYSWSPRDLDKPKYGPHNLNLYQQRSSAHGSSSSPAGGGVYGSHAPVYNGYGEHRVHHSVVNVSNDPAPRLVQSSGGAAYKYEANYTQSELAHPFFRRQQDVMNPEEITTETVNHYQISQGNETKHVTSINVNTKTSVHLGDDDIPGPKNIVVTEPRASNHCSQCGTQNSVNNEQSYIQMSKQMGKTQCNHMSQFPQGTISKIPVVLAEVNIPDRIVNGQKPDTDRVQYAELMFNKRPLQRSSSHNSLKEEKCNTVKGILKQPKSAKRVEFNKEVDVNLFNTLSTLSRHESLESLSIFDQQAVARDHHMMQNHHNHAAPLDDTDLYMYTLRRNRCGPTKWPAYGSMAWRQPTVATWLAPNPWAVYGGCKATVPYKQQSMRTMRMMPTNGPDRHYYW